MITYKKRQVVLGWYIYTRREQLEDVVKYTHFLANENNNHAEPLRYDDEVPLAEADEFYEDMQVDLFLSGILSEWLTISENEPDEELDKIFTDAEVWIDAGTTRVHRY